MVESRSRAHVGIVVLGIQFHPKEANPTKGIVPEVDRGAKVDCGGGRVGVGTGEDGFE
jgi:hypothetical protein